MELSTSYDDNIDGISSHSEDLREDVKEDFLESLQLNLGIRKNLGGTGVFKINYSGLGRLYFKEFEENLQRHALESSFNVNLYKGLNFSFSEEVTYHDKFKEDFQDYLNNVIKSTFVYKLTDSVSLLAGYRNQIKDYHDNEKWNYSKNSFKSGMRFTLSEESWIDLEYEGQIYRGKNNEHFEKENFIERIEERNLFREETAKGRQHIATIALSRIIFGKGAFNIKYKFQDNESNEVIDVKEDRELAEIQEDLVFDNSEQDFSFLQHEISLAFAYPIRKELSLNLFLLYQYQKFDGDAFPEEPHRIRRLDRLAVAKIFFKYPLFKNAYLKLQYILQENESNYKEKEYIRNLYSFSLNYSF